MVKIRETRPTRLYVFADGPKSGDAGDQRKCDEARGLLGHVDWPCEVIRVYNDENYGLRIQIEEKLSFLFAREKAAVILEDDCLPENDFFRFCEDGLHAYEKSPQLMAITGNQYPVFRIVGVGQRGAEHGRPTMETFQAGRNSNALPIGSLNIYRKKKGTGSRSLIGCTKEN